MKCTLVCLCLLSIGRAAAPARERLAAPAILALSPADAIEVKALESDLEMIGVPWQTTSDPSQILQAPLVVVAGTLTNTALSPLNRERLYSYVEHGGMLFATHVQGSQFFPLFGIAGFTTSRTNFGIRLADSAQDPALRYINRPEEKQIRLGDPKRYHEVDWTTEYRLTRAMPLGHFLNQAVAFARNYYGRGTAYCLGVSFSDSTLRRELGESFEAEKDWANVFAPSADVIRLLLRALYESSTRLPILIHPIPNGEETTLILSHDIDARESFANSVVFASLEQRYGVKSTYFVTTKYFTDSADTGYYTAKNVTYLRELYSRGFDLGSHSVSHLKSFEWLPLGPRLVNFVSYRPDSAPTVRGEVRVSKELLERDIPGHRTLAFRAGELSHPPQLITALEEAGYLVDSTGAAGLNLTNFAWRPLRETHLGASVSPLIEIPVTLDDSMGYLTPASFHRVVAQWKEIIAANGENNALTCLLIHPTNTTYKLAAEERLLQACRGKPIWIGDVTSFGLFAHLRALVRVDAFRNGNRLLLRLNRLNWELPAGLTLVLPSDSSWASVIIEDRRSEPVLFRTIVRGNRRFLVVVKANGPG